VGRAHWRTRAGLSRLGNLTEIGAPRSARTLALLVC
jgi:hypothetical protein